MKFFHLAILFLVLASPSVHAGYLTFDMYASYNGSTYSGGDTLTLTAGDTIDFSLSNSYKGYEQSFYKTYGHPEPPMFGTISWLSSRTWLGANRVTRISYEIDFGTFSIDGVSPGLNNSYYTFYDDFSVTFDTAGTYLVKPEISFDEYIQSSTTNVYVEKSYFFWIETGSRTWTDIHNSYQEDTNIVPMGTYFVINVAPVPAPVPIPGAVWLFGSGLLGLVGFSKRKKLAA